MTVGLKDIYFTAGKPTEGNPKLYEGFVPDFDATAVARLKGAGTVILGKTGTSELATATPSPANDPWAPGVLRAARARARPRASPHRSSWSAWGPARAARFAVRRPTPD